MSSTAWTSLKFVTVHSISMMNGIYRNLNLVPVYIGQVEKADMVGRGRGRGHGRGHGHGHEHSFFSPLQCRTEAKHGYSLAKSCLLSLLLASFPGSPTREQK